MPLDTLTPAAADLPRNSLAGHHLPLHPRLHRWAGGGAGRGCRGRGAGCGGRGLGAFPSRRRTGSSRAGPPHKPFDPLLPPLPSLCSLCLQPRARTTSPTARTTPSPTPTTPTSTVRGGGALLPLLPLLLVAAAWGVDSWRPANLAARQSQIEPSRNCKHNIWALTAAPCLPSSLPPAVRSKDFPWGPDGLFEVKHDHQSPALVWRNAVVLSRPV